LNELLPVDDALRRILSQIVTLPAEDAPVVQTLGRVLAEDIVARVNVPPFANSSMDGYAVRAGDVKGASRDAPVRLKVVMDIRAGLMPDHAVGPNQAARIMTGAPLPEGADAVIPVEQTDDRWASEGYAPLPDSVAVFRSPQPGDHVRPVGENIQAGQSVLRAGAVLRPQDIGVLVSVGLGRIPVVRQPRVAILSSGDELVDIDEEPAPGQIRNSNGYMLAGLVTVNGGIPIRLPVARDTLEDVRRCFHDALAQKPDLILSSAGVSVGTHDVVRTVVNELGRVELWRVNLRPGKPLAFGQVQGVPFFGLPGNPVSAMVTFELFVRPALLVQTGRRYDEVPMVEAVVGEAIDSDGRRSYLRVTLSREDDRLVARSTGTQSSGALLSMVLADGLLVIPEGVTHVAAGDTLPVRLLRDVGSGL
jgi:molybdopterin molybdotransferase